MKNIRHTLSVLATCCYLGFPSVVAAGQGIGLDAGRILQDSLPSEIAPSEPALELKIEAQTLSDVSPGGPTALVKGIRFEGNTVFSDEVLLAVFSDDVLNRSYDLGGLRDLANQISQYYWDAGYSFARAFVPAQSMDDDELLIYIVEGSYGKVDVSGDAALTAGVQAYLDRLRAGAVINEEELERVMAILGDVPGIIVSPVMQMGELPGTADIDVYVESGKRIQGSVQLDNHGNRFSGEYRGGLSLSVNRLLTFGDTLDFRGLYSSEDLWLGSLTYALPLGTSGLRGNVGYSHMDYDLGNLDPGVEVLGISKTTTLGVSYPLRRSQDVNVSLSASYQHKDLDDTSFGRQTRSDMLPLVLQFDWRDAWLSNAVTYGAATLSPGKLRTRNTVNGEHDKQGFTKLNVQIARLQSVSQFFTLYGNFSGQLADTTLDSSETFSLGGANGVRAFPQGEATGSQGYVLQLELRANYPTVSPYVLIDYGYIPKRKEDEIRREISGAGLGVRANYNDLNANFSVAWKTTGGDATSDTKQRDPRLWFSLGYRF